MSRGDEEIERTEMELRENSGIHMTSKLRRG